MTTSDLFRDRIPPHTAPVSNDHQTARALRAMIFGPQTALHTQVRDIVVALPDQPQSGTTYSEQTTTAPDLLRTVIRELGRPAREIAADPQLRGALCDWAQIAAPRLLLVLTGHFDLAIGAILALGNGSDYQQKCLQELDTAATLGALMLTELGGTNGADQQTTATWDPVAGGFVLTTPCPAAVKFMPNVADPHVPKTVVVTARVLVHGRDEGVLPFLLRLRTADGLADGVEVVRLPDKDSAPMDHAMVRFHNVRLPADALLGGDWARIGTDGQFECALPVRRRFHAAISVLGNGRLDLANAAIASARAALAGLVNYSQQRRPGTGTRMADRDAVQRDLVGALVEVYATSVLGRRIRDMRAEATQDGSEDSLWSMLAKPLLSNTAHHTLITCRQRAAAQGALRINHLQDWIGNLDAIITAEGENQILQVTAGKIAASRPPLRLPHTSSGQPWYIALLQERERAITAAIREGTFDSVGVAFGPDSAAIELSTAIAERLAAQALLAAARSCGNTLARQLASSAAAAYALQRIRARAVWYTTHRHMSPERAGQLTTELHRHYGLLIAHLPVMVDAFDIPTLTGPIFSGDYVRAWQNHAGWADTSFSTSSIPIRR